MRWRTFIAGAESAAPSASRPLGNQQASLERRAVLRRREFLSLLSAVAMAHPLPAVAQHQRQRMRRIGMLLPFAESDRESQTTRVAFEQKLQELGWTIGRNIQIDYRYAPGGAENLKIAAAEIIALQPDVVTARTTPAAAALQRETRTIPIVIVGVADPVGGGFVQSLARPGGNITGFTNAEPSMGGKWLEVLKDIAPSMRRAALMFNPNSAPYFDHYQRFFAAAGTALSVATHSTPLDDPDAIEDVMRDLARDGTGGLVIMPDVFTTNHGGVIIKQAARYRVPAIFPFRYFAVNGGLISYGVDTLDQVRRVPTYVDRILGGEKPGELPVQTPTKFELVINLKTANALGVTVPQTLLARADDLIE